MRPDLLMSRTMKARYFSGKFVWEIGQKGIDSWCRKSLLIARGMLEEGMRIRVGDGDQIKVWEDRWLPDTEDGWLRSKRNPESTIQRVSKLIKDGKWDQELLLQEFDEPIRSSIARTPLSLGNR